MVCVVVIFKLLTLSSEQLVCFIRVLFADSDSGVKIEKKHTQYAVVYCYRVAYLSVGFPKSVRLNIIMFMYSPIFFVPCLIIDQLHVT